MNFDHVIVIDIYAAREKNIYGVSEEQIVNKLKEDNVDAIYISDYDEIVDYLRKHVKENDIILTLGAGNVTKIAKKFNTNVNEIKRLNNLKSNILYVGQTLRVPEYYKAEDTNISYVVKRGDSLYSIARQYGVNVNDLMKVNNLTSDLLSIGQIINIPSSTTIVTPSEDDIINEENTYVVKNGDTLWSISRIFNVSIDDIKNKNNLTSDILTVGSVLTIPTGTETGNDIIVYTVKRGDSLWKLARDYNTTINDIKQLNNLKSDVLRVGDELQIKKNTNV